MLRSELIAELRGKIGDKTAPFRWDEATLVRHLAEGQRILCEDTGFFRDSTTFTIIIEDNKKVYPLPTDAIIEVFALYLGEYKVLETQWSATLNTGSITFSEQFDAGTILTIRAWRYPLFDLDHKTNGVYDKEAELPRDLHMGIVYRAAYALFVDPDEELGSAARASDMLTNYSSYVRKGRLLFQRTHGVQMDCAPNIAYRV